MDARRGVGSSKGKERKEGNLISKLCGSRSSDSGQGRDSGAKMFEASRGRALGIELGI